MMAKLLKIWNWVEIRLIGLSILAALCVFLGGAFLRAVAPAHAIDWAEEVALYGIIWATILSGSAIVAEKRHIFTEVFISRLPAPARKIIGWAMSLLTACFCVVMIYFGWQAFDFALLLDECSASTLRAPQAYTVFLALPVGMALILFRISLLMLGGDQMTDTQTDIWSPGDKLE